MTAEAIALEDQERDRALDLAQEALKLDPALVPAASVAARALIATGNTRRAQKILRATWDQMRHPDLAEIMARAVPGEGPEARFERIRDFVGNPDAHIESGYALAKAALAARRLDVARQALATHAADHPPARVCALMGEIEDSEGDKGKSREWFARAVHAPRDPLWVSDGVASPRWTPVSPVTGEIVPCEWKVPFDVLPPAPADMPGPEEAAAVVPQAALPASRTATEPAVSTPFKRPPDDPGVDADGNGMG
jgi:HemY protein